MLDKIIHHKITKMKDNYNKNNIEQRIKKMREMNKTTSYSKKILQVDEEKYKKKKVILKTIKVLFIISIIVFVVVTSIVGYVVGNAYKNWNTVASSSMAMMKDYYEVIVVKVRPYFSYSN